MKRLYCVLLYVLVGSALLLTACSGPKEDPIQGEWRVVDANGTANPDIFSNTVWKFENNRYIIKDFKISGKYELGMHGGNNTITLIPNNKAEVRGAGIYMLKENGRELIMKLGNAENEKPNFPEDFTVEAMWYDVLVLERQ